MASSSHLESLVVQISCLRSLSTTTQYFIPESKLKALFTDQIISQAVYELDCQPDDRIGLVAAIKEDLIITFSLLIWIRHAPSIVKFWRRGYCDKNLPLEETEARLVIPDCVTLFTQEQHQFRPHFFRLGDDRELKPAVILPFVREIEKIDTGGFGIITQVEIHPLMQDFEPRSDLPVLIIRKTLRNRGGKMDRMKMFQNEKRSLKLLNCLKHPNVITFLGAFVHHQEFNFLFPKMDMDLESFFKQGHRQGNFRWNCTFLYALNGLASALGQVHNIRLQTRAEGIEFDGIGYHHDLRPANVLVNEKTFILADFGISSLKPSDQSSRTPWKAGAGDYLAPECMNDELSHQDVGRAIDVWAFGCLMAEVVTFMARGKEGLVEFRESRLSPGIFPNSETTLFYDNDGNVKRSVLRWLSSLAFDLSCSAISQPLESLVQTILTTVRQRPPMSVVSQQLSHISMKAYFNAILERLTKIIDWNQSAGSGAQYSMKLWFERERLRAFGSVLSLYDTTLDNEILEPSPVVVDSCFPHMIRLFERLQWSNSRVADSAISQGNIPATQDFSIDSMNRDETEVSENAEARTILEKDVQNLILQLWDILPDAQARKAENLWVNAMLDTDDINKLNRLENALSTEKSIEYQGGATKATMRRLRLQLSRNPGSGSDYQDVEISRRLVTEVDMKYLHHVGKYQQDPASQKKTSVIIEWMYHDIKIWQQIPAVENSSVMALRAKGFNISPKPKSLRMLHCFGFFEDPKGYGFVYEIPQSDTGCDTFTTLNQLFVQSMQQASNDPYLNQPLLGDKYLLAHRIADCILEFHSIGWLHENLHSHNIMFFIEKRHDSGISPDRSSIIREPYVVGLYKSRPSGQGWHTEGPEAESIANFQNYQHPGYHITKRFRLSYDYYALGLLLLEIGLWTPLMTWRNRTDLIGLSSDDFRHALALKYVPRLGPRMGKVYRDITKLLLTDGLDGSHARVPDQEHERAVFGRFFEEVSEPLAKLADIWC